MDDELKIMITGTMKILSNLQDKSWSFVLATMVQNALFEADSQEVARADKLIKNSSNGFKFDGSPNASIIREVSTWFVNLLSDNDVLESAKIESDFIAKIVAQSGAIIDSFESLFTKDYHQNTLVKISVLRFPDINRPFFKVSSNPLSNTVVKAGKV